MIEQPELLGLQAPALRVMTKAEASYRHIRGRILEGTLEPGSIVNQEALAAELGLSVTPLREALRRLEAEGFLTLEAHRTVTIVPLTAREVRELYVVRLQLDPLAGALAAEYASDEQLKEISRLAHRRAAKDPAGQFRENREFHRGIYDACGNRVLGQVLDHLWDRTDRYRWILLQHGRHGRAVGEEHREIARALVARDGPRVADLLRTHVEKTVTLITQTLPDDI